MLALQCVSEKTTACSHVAPPRCDGTHRMYRNAPLVGAPLLPTWPLLMFATAHVPPAAHPCQQGGTYGGSALGCAAAAATIDVIEEEGLLQVELCKR